MNNIVIFNPKVASELVSKGFRIVNLLGHNDNPDKTVYYFERTKELERVLDEEMKIRHK